LEEAWIDVSIRDGRLRRRDEKRTCTRIRQQHQHDLSVSSEGVALQQFAMAEVVKCCVIA
jgi:hypothetical protein